jgi:Retron-type reverse transcriptase
MIEVIQAEIERKARRILDKYRRGVLASQKHAKRFTKRTGLPSVAAPQARPGYWDYHTQFDPVYCIKHSKYLAKVIWTKIQAGTYEPIPAILFEIAKPDGGTRPIMQFAIPDSAVANVFHTRLSRRNKGIFSAYSFAYRQDKNIFEAILHLHRMMQPPKTYVLKYDYRQYFDTINHVYLKKLIEQETFVVTRAERNAISAFLTHRFASYPSWQTMHWERRTVGVPQGSSLSLFLSNIAAHELDMELERLNGSFVRFADDVIAVAHSYSDARNIELEFREHCKKTGVEINFEKSPGITLLSGIKSQDDREFFLDRDDGSSLRKTDCVDFLGHRVSSNQITLTPKAIKRIKKKISRIINIHVILYARRNPPSPISSARLGPGFLDWDLVTCINEIRRYIYGGLKEADLARFIDQDVKLKYVRGLMAFYPLITTPKDLIELDGWLKNVLRRAIRERNKLILAQGPGAGSQYQISEEQLISGAWYTDPIPNETQLPSFVRGWRAARKFYKRYGLSEIDAPSYYSAMTLYT